MRRKKIILPNEKILSLLEERIMAGEAVRLPVRGYSMSPWLLDGRDTVILHPVDPAGIVVGDVILYRWKDAFLMHRVVEIKGAHNRPACGLPEGASGGLPGGASGGLPGGASGGLPDAASGGLPEGASGGLPQYFICRGDALQTSELVPVSDVIARAELPAHSPRTLRMRRVRGWLQRVRGLLRRVWGSVWRLLRK